MYRRYVNCSGLCAASFSLVLLALTACTSTPSVNETAPSATPSEIQSAPAATSAATDSKQAPLASATEAPLPPEATQQFDKAVMMMTAGDTAAAEQAFRTLASAYPAYSGPLLNLGILQAKANRLEEAEKTLKSAVERNAASAPAFNQLGIVYRRLGRFADADAAYQQALKLDPNYANAYLNLGVLCDLYLQQPQRALEAFERYLQLAASPDEKVATWVSELKARLSSQQRAARTE